MRRNGLWALASLLLSVAASPAAAQEEVARYLPSGHWVADYAEDHCALRRDFGVEGDRMLLEFRQYEAGHAFDLLVGSDRFDTVEDEATVAFLPGEAVPLGNARRLRARSGIEGFAGRAILRPPPRTGDVDEVVESTIMVQEDDPARAYAPVPTVWTDDERSEREASITAIRFPSGFERDIEVATGPLDEAMNALRVCMDDLIRSRGLDPDAPTSELSRRARPVDIGRLARMLQRRYPVNALVRGQEASLRIVLQIDPEGRVRGCDVMTDIDPEVFRREACERLERYARFEPALDHVGNPTNGTWSTTVLYRMN